MNYVVIGLIILGLYIVHRLALRKAQRDRDESWMMVALFTMVLEVEARKARDRQKAKDYYDELCKARLPLVVKYIANTLTDEESAWLARLDAAIEAMEDPDV